jgi:hypothetical protein
MAHEMVNLFSGVLQATNTQMMVHQYIGLGGYKQTYMINMMQQK